MGHEISSIAWTGERPWHGIGIELPEPMTSSEAILQAGLDWTVEKRALSFGDNYGRLREAPNVKAVIRKSDCSVLGIVTDSYVPVQNKDAFTFMDCLVEEGMMRYDVAGSLRNGQRVWMLGNVGMSEIIPGDKVGHYLLLYNTHDGTGSLRCLFTNVRVVCANTARIALAGGAAEGIKIRHMGNVKDHLATAKKMLGLAHEAFAREDEMILKMTQTALEPTQFRAIIEELFPLAEDAVRTGQIDRARREIANLYVSGRGQLIQGVGGTAWAAFNSVTEYLNYKKPTRGNSLAEEKRFEGSLFGSGVQIIDKARKLLLAA